MRFTLVLLTIYLYEPVTCSEPGVGGGGGEERLKATVGPSLRSPMILFGITRTLPCNVVWVNHIAKCPLFKFLMITIFPFRIFLMEYFPRQMM